MRRVQLGEHFEDFRAAARALLQENVAPGEVFFESASGNASLFPEAPPSARAGSAVPTVPRRFLELAETVAVHRSPERWPLLYEVLWRLTHGEPQLLADEVEPRVRELELMKKAVLRDVHKTHAFVRFRKVTTDGVDHYIAWHHPDHRCLRLAVPLFVRRFGSMHWSILTPDESADWDTQTLRLGPGVPRSEAPVADELESLWLTYYASVFNPARANLRATRQEMPVRHWATLPEASLIPKLLQRAPQRTHAMVSPRRAVSESEAFLPEHRGLPSLRKSVQDCRACPLYENATQAVFGEGKRGAAIMLVGEQPGDHEDLEGKPFVGPAGKLLDEVLEQVGLPRQALYVTNAVKHFSFVREGKRRIHQKPNTREIHACRGWLEAEVRTVEPRIILALGATAGQSFLGSTFRLVRSRGQFFETPWTPYWMATYHPSALLRMPDAKARDEARRHFTSDLGLVAHKWHELEKSEPRHPAQSDEGAAQDGR